MKVGIEIPKTIAVAAQTIASLAGFEIPSKCQFLIVPQESVGPDHPFSREKLCVVLAIYKYEGFEKKPWSWCEADI